MKSLLQVQQEFLTGAVQLVVPEMVLVGVACLLFVVGLLRAKRCPAFVIGWVGLIGAVVAAVLVGRHEVADFWKVVEGTPYAARSIAPFDPTGAAAFVRWLALGAGAIFLLISWAELADETAAEYVACLLVVVAGTSLVGRANDLVALFLALELISIPTYILLYLPARTKAGQEAAVKYFLLSILSSGILLFGFSYLFGLTGSTNIGAILDGLTEAHRTAGVSPMALVAIIMVVAGLGFRVTAVPFHFYAPDVYEGGPTGVVAQIAFVPKVAGFIALARLLGFLTPSADQIPFDAARTLVPLTLWVVAVVTMTFGNFLALLQDNLKRLLAYSGIAHGGYMLIGLVVAASLTTGRGAVPGVTGPDALLVYLVAYGLMTVGAIAVIAHLNGPGRSTETVADLAGVAKSNPVAAGAFAVLLFSMIGMPLTAGFAGKFLVFLSAFDAPTDTPMKGMYRILVVIAAVNAAIGAVYYLRLIGVMYLGTPKDPAAVPASVPARWPLAAAVVCAVATVVLGAYPKPLVDAARAALPVKDDQPAAVADAGQP
ncbi:NADH-quinone oxidoreductase subunit N [Fimbriiglobus ruber]|uniref:NADH-quinone oxidoreductase subunit N n=1 Tax=Fimbriiglobus ruber TaxID=1908690 RepID=A0A225DPT9_9BACT|nr:NADH-quinone oxidoreductase subunit N [Fimbriiglobus ruber]OWK41654.1 NADH-ubiquinone oxidoreductase chain N [Fimbriiglobus ruber]